MGSNSSKSNNETSVLTIQHDTDVCNSLDPRSPTPDVIRTPLQTKPGGKHNITKNVDLRKTFETANTDEKLIHKNPILSAVIKNHLQSYDPRSPTQDFERTPIVIASNMELHNDKNLLRIQNENYASPQLKTDYEDTYDRCAEAHEISPDLVVPKNLCDGFYDLSINETLKDTEEPLGSSTASNDAIENNISNVVIPPTTLLETNFEYIGNENDNFEDIVETVQNLNASNPEENIHLTPQFEILDDDPRSPSIGIERTPIVVSKIDEETNEDNVEEMSDDKLIKVLQSKNVELRNTIPKTRTADGLLIYEDEGTNINDTPKKSKSSNTGARTPLSCMKNKSDGHTRSKSANTLYDPKSQKSINNKTSKHVSHIPRLKSLTKPSNLTGSTISLKTISRVSTIGGDCENTPPHSNRDRWDKDNSIVL